jgi:hypothetical protein
MTNAEFASDEWKGAPEGVRLRYGAWESATPETRRPELSPRPCFKIESSPLSGECQKLLLEHVLGDIGADDLVLHFATLEEE